MTLRKDYYVYAYLRSRDSENGEAGSPYYIGKGRRDRADRCHRAHNISVPEAGKSYIVYIAKDLNEQDAFQLEVFFIYLFGRVDLGTGCLRNKTNGGEGGSGHVMPDEVKRQVSWRFKGKKHTPEQIEKNRLGHLGKVMSAETRMKMSKIVKGRKASARTIEVARQRKGWKHSEEAKEKIGAASKKRGQSEATRAKMREIANNRTPEALAKIREGFDRAMAIRRAAKLAILFS